MTAAIYARKSTDEGDRADETKSVARQIAHAREYATRKGWTVLDAHVYSDDGISGAEFEKRPGFVRLMNALTPRPSFEVLIVSEESRIGREQIQVSFAVQQLIQAGVRVFCYLDDRERTLDSPIEKAMLALQAMADEMESVRAGQRSSDKAMQQAHAGFITGGKLFGYNNERSPAGVRRTINEAEAEVVRRIYALAQQGRGYTAIAKQLNEEGAASPRAQRGRPSGWASSSIREVIFNPHYKGEVVWNKTKKRDKFRRKRQRARDESEWLRRVDESLAIVAPALWDAVHARIAAARSRYATSSNGSAPWSREPRYLLTGLLRCTCGAGMEARSRPAGKGTRVFYYECAAYHSRGKAVCANSLIAPMELADAAIRAAFRPALRLAMERAIEGAVRRLTTPQEVDRAALKRELRTVEQELEQLAEVAATTGHIEAVVKKLRQREARRKEILAVFSATKQQPVFDPDYVRADLLQQIDAIDSLLQADVPRARQMLTLLIDGRLEMVPNRDDRSYSFRGTGTLRQRVTGSVASPPGLPAFGDALNFKLDGRFALRAA